MALTGHLVLINAVKMMGLVSNCINCCENDGFGDCGKCSEKNGFDDCDKCCSHHGRMTN